MAAGDNAATRGMTLVPGSGMARDLETYINTALDYIDQYTRWAAILGKPSTYPNTEVNSASPSGAVEANWGKLVRWSDNGKLSCGNPTSADHVANKAYVDNAVNSGSDSSGVGSGAGKLARFNGDGLLGGPAPTAPSHLANKAYVDSGFTNPTFSGAAQFNGSVGVDGNLRASSGVDMPAVYGNTLGGTWRSLYIRSNGELGWVSSSRRFKKNIKEWAPDRQAILAMQLVEFQYKVAIDRDGVVQHGLIAEQLHELGLEWLVDYDADGTPEGVRYDQISLALLSVVQDHEDRLSRLEARA